MIAKPIILTKRYAILDRICFVLLCVLLADCCIFGGGRLISFGPIGFRMAVFALLLLASVPLLYLNRHKLLKNRYLWCAVAFGIWSTVSAVLGICRNNSTEVLLSDVKGYCYFAILPTVLCVLNSKRRVQVLMKVILFSSAFLAVVHVITLLVYLHDKVAYDHIFIFFLLKQIGALGRITDSAPRMFFSSVIYLFCGCGFSMYFFVRKKRNFIYPCVAGVCLFAILLSYTRSIYGGFIIAAVVCILALLVLCPQHGKIKLAVFLLSAVVLFSTVTAVFSVYRNFNYFIFAINRTMVSWSEPNIPSVGPTNPVDPTDSTDPTEPTDPGTSGSEDDQANAYLQMTLESDALRKETLAEMFDKIVNSPVFGNGLGTIIEFRNDFDGGLSEYFYLDLWMKSGLIGLLLYMLPVGCSLLTFKRWRGRCSCWIWLGILLGIMAVSFFNPYMNASLGILFYCCTLAVLSLSEHTNENPCKSTITQEETK